MRDISQNLHKSATIRSEATGRRGGRVLRLPVDGDRENVASAIHHCLKYLSTDARRNGMAQTASILDMAAHLAVDEARAVRSRG